MATDIPAVDYTDKDFRSMRRALLDLAAYRVPEWTDRSPGDLGMLWVDLFSYVCDAVGYYQERLASELYLDTAVERRSVMHLLRLIGYELAPASPAATSLRLEFDPPGPQDPTTTRIPRGFSVSTEPDPASGRPSIPFTYLGDALDIDLTGPLVTPAGDRLRYEGLPVVQGTLQQPAVIGSSRGEPGLRLGLPGSPVILDSVVLEVREGGSWRVWPRRRNLFTDEQDGRTTVATSASEGYMLEVDAQAATWAVFGDGEFHRRAPVGDANVRASYAVGGGSAGNVAAGTITRIADKGKVPRLATATNPLAAVGGTDAEAIERARRFAPLAFRSGDRAVTLRDHITLALQVPGVAKVRAKTVSWNRVDLFIAPTGPEWAPISEDLRNRVLTHLEDRRMIGTSVRVRDAEPVPVDIAVDVYAEPHHEPGTVRQRAEDAVRALLAYDTVEFGRALYLSKIYEAVEALDGVRAATVTRFRRRSKGVPRRSVPFARPLQQLDQLDLSRYDLGDGLDPAEVVRLVKRAVVSEIPPDGRIELAELELPTAGDISVALRYES
ncbi:MAG: baseplate J/gp47 family protein [Acidimicrobiia bacterium]